jgi:hypothetical protein
MAQHGDLYLLDVRRATQTNEAKSAPDDHERQRANHHDTQRATAATALVTALMLSWHPTRVSWHGRRRRAGRSL